MNVVRIIPPLVTTADEVDQALRILDESLAAAGRVTAPAATAAATSIDVSRRRSRRSASTAIACAIDAPATPTAAGL